jgi:1,4-dihydroxy-2-naphthoate polyprenyltransferase
MTPSTLGIWISAARPRTLPAAVAPVLVGSALAWRDGGFVPLAAGLCLAFALLIQIGTNFANDYFDFVKGADTAERVGPRRAVAAGLVSPGVMKAAMAGVFAAAFLTGLFLLPFGGWPLLVIGVLSILCGIAYTGGPYPLAYHGLGDVFVFVFFGLVAVGATVFVQQGTLSPDVWWAASGVGALAANILVVNNYRDAETDARAGKRTLVVLLGRPAARLQYAASLLGALGALVWACRTAPPVGVLVAVAGLGGLGYRHFRRLGRPPVPAELIGLLGDTGRFLGLYSLVSWFGRRDGARGK